MPDPDLGLYYLRARYFNPLAGRFLTRDTDAGRVQAPITLHKYLYAYADPVNYSDPSGHDGFTVQQVVAIGLAVIFFLDPIVENIECIEELSQSFLEWLGKGKAAQITGRKPGRCTVSVHVEKDVQPYDPLRPVKPLGGGPYTMGR